eukprot:2305609-Pleurochrysis_carterae.AAC.6
MDGSACPWGAPRCWVTARAVRCGYRECSGVGNVLPCERVRGRGSGGASSVRQAGLRVCIRSSSI